MKKKRTTFRLAALLFAVLMALSLFGCGQKKPEAQETTVCCSPQHPHTQGQTAKASENQGSFCHHHPLFPPRSKPR